MANIKIFETCLTTFSYKLHLNLEWKLAGDFERNSYFHV